MAGAIIAIFDGLLMLVAGGIITAMGHGHLQKFPSPEAKEKWEREKAGGFRTWGPVMIVLGALLTVAKLVVAANVR